MPLKMVANKMRRIIMARRKMNENMIASIWKRISDNNRICDTIYTENKDGMIYSALPVEMDGYDYVLVLNDFDMLTLHFNRLSPEVDLLSDKKAIISFDPEESIPEKFVTYARQLMKNRCNYLETISRNWFGGNYKKQCELNYDGCVSYFDLFENFAPVRMVG